MNCYHWLPLMLYLAMFNREIKSQSVVSNDQPSDTMQHLAGLLNNLIQLLSQQQHQTRQLVQAQTQAAEQVSGKFDRMNDTIINLNQTLSQHQESLTDISQTLVQLNEKFHQQSQDIAQLNRTLVQGQYTEDQISQTLSKQNQAIGQIARHDLVNFCVNQSLIFDGHVKELGVKIDLQNQLKGQISQNLEQQSQTLSKQHESLTNLSQTLGQLSEKLHKQSQDIAQLNRTLVKGEYTDDQISQTLSLQNQAIRQMNDNCSRQDLVNFCVNQTLIYDGLVRGLGVKIDLQYQLNGQMNEKLQQQSQLLLSHFNQGSRQQIASLSPHQQELGNVRCSAYQRMCCCSCS